MINNENDNVAVLGYAHKEMSRHWDMTRTLLGGTYAMREAGKSYLPQYPAEENDDYAIRLKRAVLTNYYAMTIKHLVGKAFSRPLVLGDDVPAQIVNWCEDVDLQGTHINDFAAELFREALGMGFASIFVDHPKAQPGATLADEKASGARPYMAMIRPESLLGVRTSGRANSIQLARILEQSVEPAGTYGEAVATRVRVLFPGGYQIFEQKDDKEYVLVDEGIMNPLKRVPLVPVYGQKEGSWIGKPPLLDLAYKNIQHYQVDSDHDNALHVASFPILAVSGWEEDRDPAITIGPNRVLATGDPQGKYYYVEHSGASLGAGRQRLEDLKADMATMGIQMLMPSASGGAAATATETQVKYAEATSDLQRMAFGLKDALENALMLMGEWVGLSDGGSIELKGQFTMPRDAATEAQALIALRNAGEITSHTLLSELKRRDFLPDDFNVEEEIEAVAAEDHGGE